MKEELGGGHGFGLVVFPVDSGHPCLAGEPAEFSVRLERAPSHMHGCLRALVAKWDAGMGMAASREQ